MNDVTNRCTELWWLAAQKYDTSLGDWIQPCVRSLQLNMDQAVENLQVTADILELLGCLFISNSQSSPFLYYSAIAVKGELVQLLVNDEIQPHFKNSCWKYRYIFVWIIVPMPVLRNVYIRICLKPAKVHQYNTNFPTISALTPIIKGCRQGLVKQ